MRRALLLLLLLAASSAAAQVPEVELPNEAHLRRKVVAADGAALALYRFVPAGGGGLHPAVLLVPDVAYAKEIYDFQGRGLARFLQAKGRDTFIIELRGQGHSSTPKDWSLLDWVERDLPAAIAAVQRSHAGPVDLVVQGYGGALVLAATTDELKGQVGRVIAFNTPVTWEVPNELLRKTLESGGRFSQLSRSEFELLFAHKAELTPGTGPEFRGLGLGDLSPRAAAELLGWLQSGSVAFRDGSTLASRIAGYDRPTLLMLPLLDSFSHPEHSAPLRDRAKTAKIQVQSLSKFDLLSEDYTHLSVLLGREAQAELFEGVHRFLNAPAVEPSTDAGTR